MYYVKLSLSKISISKKPEFADGISDKVTGKPEYSNVATQVSLMDTASADLNKAIIKAEKGTVADTKAMYARASDLDKAIMNVVTIIDLAAADMAVDAAIAYVTGAGLSVKAKPVRKNAILALKQGDVTTEIVASRRAVQKPKSSYYWEYAEDADGGLVWVSGGTSTVSKTTFANCKELTKYWVRVALIQGNKTLDFIDPVSIVTGKKD